MPPDWNENTPDCRVIPPERKEIASDNAEIRSKSKVNRPEHKEMAFDRKENKSKKRARQASEEVKT